LLAPVRVALDAAEAEAAASAATERTPGRRVVAGVIDAQPADAIDAAVLSRIEAASEGRVGDGLGRAVAQAWTFCGACDRCTRGMQTHCPNRREFGTSELPGALAERVVLPIRCLAAVGPAVDDDQAAFASLLGEAIHATNQLHLGSKAYVTVLGDTAIGLLCAQLMARRNTSVRLVGTNEHKLALCEKWGVKHRPLDAVGRHADQDIVVDCTGGAPGLRVALGLVRARGQIVLRWPWRLTATGRNATDANASPDASSAAPAEPDLGLVAQHELTILGSRGGQLNDAVRMLERGEVDVVSLISKRLGFDDAEKALRAAREPDAISVLVSM
jgi:threonine dehydrogenase-like Zn-dependent dehydrogenase